MTIRSTRTVVVTGSASGIGDAIARRLARDSWRVVGVDLKTVADAPHLAEQYTADLADRHQVEALAASLGGANALVHAAGLMRTGSIAELNPEDGGLMWAVHVRALTLLVQMLSPSMQSGGRIIAIGSRTARGAANRSQYAASKAAMTAVIRSIALEFAGRGITANIISPAATDTPMLSQSSRASVAPVLPPIGRFIRPDEIAAYVAFIASPEAAAITGQELLICGGASI